MLAGGEPRADRRFHRVARAVDEQKGRHVLVAEVELRCSETLVGGLAEPAHGFSVVLRHPLAAVVHDAEIELRFSETLVGGLAVPAGRFGVVLRHPWPCSYMMPRLICAAARPWSAALRYQRAASAWSCVTPW